MPRAAKAKGIASQSQKPDKQSQVNRKDKTVLSPSIEAAIEAALDVFRGTRKAAAAAWDFGWSRDTYYRRLEDPLSLTVREVLILLAGCPDPKFNARLRGHLAALDAAQAIAEREAGDTYVRIQQFKNAVQTGLPFEGKP